MEGLIDGVFAEILKANRESLNAKFAGAKRLHPGLDPESFADVLRQFVEPVVAAAERFSPEATRQVALTLYELSLDLLGQGFLDPNLRHLFLAKGWKELLPNIPQQVCAAPRLVIGSVTNALYNLSQVPNARPQEWLDIMLALAPLSTNAQTYLQAGQIAAWRAGLAHFRAAALDLCRVLPPALVHTALHLLPEDDSASTLALVDRLAADPWLHPELVKNPSSAQARGLKIVAQVGAFRGFGGFFLQPPKVSPAGEHFLVIDGESHWLLTADIFGATLHRVDGIQPSTGKTPFKIDQGGRVRYARLDQKFEALAGHTSAAANDTTLAVTSALSFAISLVAPVGN